MAGLSHKLIFSTTLGDVYDKKDSGFVRGKGVETVCQNCRMCTYENTFTVLNQKQEKSYSLFQMCSITILTCMYNHVYMHTLPGKNTRFGVM